MSESQLEKLNIARQALTEAKSIKEILDIKAMGEAIAYYAKKKKLSIEIKNDADIFLVEAEIKLGESMMSMDKNKGANGQLRGKTSSGGSKSEPPEDKKPKLSDIGITKKESSQSQLLAKNKDKVKKIIDKKIAKGEPVSKNSIIDALKPKPKDHRSQQKKFADAFFLFKRDLKPVLDLNDRFTKKEFYKFIANDMEKILDIMQSWTKPEKDCPICNGKGKVLNPPIDCDNCFEGKIGKRI